MPNVIADVTAGMLQAFADAWNRHDVDAIMSFMTADCVFEASAGPDVCGTRYAGRDAVRAGFAEVWATFPMPTGATRAILSVGTEECRSGHSQEHGRTALASKSMAAICSPFETARSP